MASAKKQLVLVGVVASVVAVLSFFLAYGLGMTTGFGIRVQGVTNFDSVTLSRNFLVKGNSQLGNDGDDVTTIYGGLINSLGAITFTDNVLIDGQADLQQLTVQGHSTQTSTNPFVVEQSTGQDVFEVTNLGGLLNDLGAITVTDNVLIDGQADAVQLTVQGHSSQSSNSFVVEKSDGTDVAYITDAGAATFAAAVGAEHVDAANGITAGGNVTVTGDLSAANATLTTLLSSENGAFANWITAGGNVTVTGALGAEHVDAANWITAGGNVTVTGDLSAANLSATTAVASENVDAANGITAGGNVTVTGDLSAANLVATTLSGASIEGAADMEHMFLPTVWTEVITYGMSAGVVTIPDTEIWIVHQVLYNVTTNFDCTGSNCTLTLGDSGDADGLLECVDADLQTTFADYTGAQAGWGGMDATAPRGAYLIGGPHVYAPSGGDETLDVVVGGTDPSAGEMTVYIIYTRIN